MTQAPAPLTSIALASGGSRLYAGCWNKLIYGTDFNSGHEQQLDGHTDFVKCLLATSIGGVPVLVSGGADSVIIVWDVTSGRLLYKLKGHTMSLQDLAIDPLGVSAGQAEANASLILFSAGSDREIRRWEIGLQSGHELQESKDSPILAHETSVYRLRFDSDGDLWTASADKESKHLVRESGWAADTVLVHPDFVKDVVVADELGLVVTACRDEEVRVWDIASGQLVCTYSGHFEEVTALVLIDRRVVSVSIDGTVRQWSLSREEMLQFQDDLRREELGEAPRELVPPPQLSAEEEAELNELMGDDDD